MSAPVIVGAVAVGVVGTGLIYAYEHPQQTRDFFHAWSEAAGEAAMGEAGIVDRPHYPDRELPRTPDGLPKPDPEAEGAPHTQLGQANGRNGKYDQAREFDANGKPVRDIDFTDHGRPQNHPGDHYHDYLPNPTGGTDQRSREPKPLSP